MIRIPALVLKRVSFYTGSSSWDRAKSEKMHGNMAKEYEATEICGIPVTESSE